MTERKVSSHADIAREIITGRNTALVPANADYLIREITDALQNAFDLGFRAAGGTVHARGERMPEVKDD